MESALNTLSPRKSPRRKEACNVGEDKTKNRNGIGKLKLKLDETEIEDDGQIDMQAIIAL